MNAPPCTCDPEKDEGCDLCDPPGESSGSFGGADDIDAPLFSDASEGWGDIYAGTDTDGMGCDDY